MLIRLNMIKQLRFKALEAVLLTKKPGDVLTYEECRPYLEGDEPREYGTRIRRWFRQNGGRELVSVIRIGWRVATGSEQLQVALDHSKRAIRQSKQALRSAVTADRNEMSREEQDVATRFIRATAGNLQMMDEVQRDSRKLLGTPRPPSPRVRSTPSPPKEDVQNQK